MAENKKSKQWWETKTAIITLLTALIGLAAAIVPISPPRPLDSTMEGKWFYKASAMSGTVFTDGCSERVGVVTIENGPSTTFGAGLHIRGKRIWCVREGNKEKLSPVIHWNSDVASRTSLTTMYFKFTTQDIKKDEAIVIGSIESKDGWPTQFSGQMYYLPPDRLRWIQSTLEFYRVGEPEAVSLIKDFPMP